ncbi:3-mercaptopyruvate sulfurtransferase [Pseudoxanthobacter sp.]|uniref:3-mercaptopyruvate sulfurtransferase n=1 Tax=Pseudoxanthobacter sp. TaxID=1925742 RepID=UPI002FE0C6EA
MASALSDRPADSEFLVGAEWLKDHLDAPKLRIVDASWHLPTSDRDARQEFSAGHIPGAVFFDIDTIADSERGLPHMLPAPAAFAAAVGKLGIAQGDSVVVYDTVGLFSAARVWWAFRVMGLKDVRVLDGGLPAWLNASGPMERGPARPATRTFVPEFDAGAVADVADVKAAIATGAATIVDARSAERFSGAVPEPRPGLKAGHMPGARNLPFTALTVHGRLKPKAELAAAFEAAGVDITRPIITSCGSGVTACVLCLALAILGAPSVRLYDGSWTEWGGRPDAEVACGPAA